MDFCTKEQKLQQRHERFCSPEEKSVTARTAFSAQSHFEAESERRWQLKIYLITRLKLPFDDCTSDCRGERKVIEGVGLPVGDGSADKAGN